MYSEGRFVTEPLILAFSLPEQKPKSCWSSASHGTERLQTVSGGLLLCGEGQSLVLFLCVLFVFSVLFVLKAV